jgi:hypothetical protein
VTDGVRAFISYSHLDRGPFDEFVVALSPLRQQGLLTEWSDVELKPGDIWYDRLSRRRTGCGSACNFDPLLGVIGVQN